MSATNMLSEAQLLRQLRALCKQSPSQNAFADEHAVDRGWLSRVLTGKRHIGVVVGAILGYEPVIMYRRKE